LNPGRNNKIVSSEKSPFRFWSPQSFLFNKYPGPFLGEKRLGSEVGPSPPLSAEENMILFMPQFPKRLCELERVNITLLYTWKLSKRGTVLSKN
jgi:hypothetical protein